MSWPKIEINTEGITTIIKCDGQEIRGIRGFTLSQKAEDIPVLSLDLNVVDLTLDGCMCPALPDVFKPFYVERNRDELDVDNNIEN